MWTVFGYIIRKRKEKKSTYPYLVRLSGLTGLTTRRSW